MTQATKEYIELSLPNVEMVDTSDATIIHGVHPFMHSFVEGLAIKHPEWKFEGRDFRNALTQGGQAKAYVWRSFEVYANKEALGKIGYEHSYGRRKDMYVIRNQRIFNTLKRGSSISTSDLKKAIKQVDKVFYTPTSKEILDQNIEDVKGVVNRLNTKKSSTIRNTQRTTEDYIMGYIRNNLNDVLQTIPDTSVQDRIVEYYTLKDEIAILDGVYELLHTTKGHKIVQRGSTYYEAVGEGVKELTNDDLPSHMKHKLGILKLVEDGQAVKDIGFRHSEDMFVLFGEQ